MFSSDTMINIENKLNGSVEYGNTRPARAAPPSSQLCNIC